MSERQKAKRLSLLFKLDVLSDNVKTGNTGNAVYTATNFKRKGELDLI